MEQLNYLHYSFEDKNTWIHTAFNFPVSGKDSGTSRAICLSPFMTISLFENKYKLNVAATPNNMIMKCRKKFKKSRHFNIYCN